MNAFMNSETSFICASVKPFYLILLLISVVAFESCRKQGCTDPSAITYEPDARKDDGSCKYRYGCIDSTAVNYNPEAVFSDQSCVYPGRAVLYIAEDLGCDTVTVALNNDNAFTLWRRFPSGQVNCGQQGAANFTLSEGTYTYYVTSDTSEIDSSYCSWTGQFSVSTDECTIVGITVPDP